uniref:Uncharacterized protein n=2 Tax=Caenorhabditis japonica TaxID=281687 RepID=A0A8R1DH04_CAEJA
MREVIIPASSIVKIVLDGKNVKKNEEIEENRAAQQAEDLGIQETMDRIPELSDEVEENAEIAEKVAERIAEKIEEEEESLGLTNEDLQNLATDLRKTVFENLMNKANELVDFNSNDQQDVEVGEAVDVENEEEKDQQEEEKEEEEEIILDLPVDPNSIISRSELPSEPEIPRSNVYESEDLDGVLLPGPELSDEEIARIAAESVQEPDEESREFVVDPVPSLPKVRGARIGEGVVPDSASQLHVFVQIFTLSLILLF